MSDAVNQLDQVTQQNAALVEESAAAADSLNSQAARLVQLVSVFQVDASASQAVIAQAQSRSRDTARAASAALQHAKAPAAAQRTAPGIAAAPAKPARASAPAATRPALAPAQQPAAPAPRQGRRVRQRRLGNLLTDSPAQGRSQTCMRG